MLVTAFTEVLTIGSIIPFVAGIVDPSKLYEVAYLRDLLQNYNIQPQQITFYSLILFVIVVILVTSTNLLFTYINIKFSQKCAIYISNKIFNNYLNEDYEVILNKNSSFFLSSIIQKNDTVVNIIQQFLLLVINILILIFITLLIFLYSPSFTLYVILIFVLFYALLSFGFKSFLRKFSIKIASLITKRTKILSETFRGFRQVILDNSQKILQLIFKSTEMEFRSIEAKTTFLAHAPRYFFEGVGMIVIALIAVYLKNQNILSANDLITYLALLAVSAQRALPKINQAFTAWTNISAMKQNLIDVNELAFNNKEKKIYNIDKNFKFENQITFKDVSFSYFKNGLKIINNLNLVIKKGEKIVIRGDSGSGKSTFLDLFLGLLKPTSGEIYIDDKKLVDENKVSYQKLISSVAQNPAFIDASISENIVFHINQDNKDYNEIHKSAKQAEIFDLVTSLENKFDTNMGENGLQLSGGQRQRISIARALYRSHEILICDEATNSLDESTEKKIIQNLLKENNKTIIFVTHNKNIGKEFDKVYNIVEGNIIKV